jgi:hypothetical protein
MDFDDLFFLILVYKMVEDDSQHVDNEPYKHSRYAKRFHKKLSQYSKQIRDRRIPRCALHYPKESAWYRLLNANNDQAMITLTGFSVLAFAWLNKLFKPIYDNYSPWISPDGHITQITDTFRGRRRLMSSMDCLGLYLAWTRTKGPSYKLCMIFGITGTLASVYIRFGRRILVKVLQRNKLSEVNIPSPELIKEYMDAIEAKHPLLKGVWCTMDGL